MQTIMIVDDEQGLREMTDLYLKSKGYGTILAEDGERALSLIQDTVPDLILLDIEMPGMDGLEVCREIRSQLSIPVIFLSVRRSTMDKVACFELGADDYMTKPFDFEELEARIKANIRMYAMNPSSEGPKLRYGHLVIDPEACKCEVEGESISLTAKEMKLLLHFAKHPNQVWTHEQLYDRIWNLDATGYVETVKVHISHLRRKIERTPNRPEYIQTVRGFGYRFVPGKH
ncbi:response regulator transcription factor [Salisediminibacterium selenitireducens]|uniref:Two component transcriptional regulator, winged helix family n=1 Tax=Bacillus selenitireducens (strain ATCC 700615 / DSM 15326 / MLS10) TaxID=439292 RepID=D6Y0P0_BACIE|nr:response regulator transcription factor [Salisediminibacterium selenitireducens]ADI00608.1 two component transcriptional regulator, winged helix family [[Bacillus] selenitireducens MLS10]